LRLDFPLLAEVSLMKRETDLERGGDNVRSAGFMEDLLVLSLLFVVDEVRGADAARAEGAPADGSRGFGRSACSRSRLNLQKIRTE